MHASIRHLRDLTLTHARFGRMDVVKTDDGRYENWSYAEPRTLDEWARIGWKAPAGTDRRTS